MVTLDLSSPVLEMGFDRYKSDWGEEWEFYLIELLTDPD